MLIYTAGLVNRNKSEWDGNDYVFGEINKNIRELLEELLSAKRSVSDQGVLSSFIGWLTDPISGLNFSRAAEYALFSPELTEQSLGQNMKEVHSISKHIMSSINSLDRVDDNFFIGQAYENLYQIFLVSMAYFNNNMATSHIYFYKDEPIKNDKLTQEAETIAVTIVEYLLQRVSMNDQKWGFRRFDALGILTSIYFISFYESVNSKNDITVGFYNKIHNMYVVVLNTHTKNGTINSNSEFCKHARLVKVILKKKKYYKKSKELNIPEFNFSNGGGMIFFESEFPQDFRSSGWNIARPIVQRDGYYYNRVEEFVAARLVQ